MTGQFIRDLAEGKVKINGLADFERLVKAQDVIRKMAIAEGDSSDTGNLVSLTEVLANSFVNIKDPKEEE